MQNTELKIIIKEKEGFRGWWNHHGNKVLIVGGIVIGAIGGYALYAHREPIGNFVEEQISRLAASSGNAALQDTICQMSSESVTALEATAVHELSDLTQTVNVSEHIRNLSGGRTPSLEKVATALEHNFVLGEHQTWVESYSKNYHCA